MAHGANVLLLLLLVVVIIVVRPSLSFTTLSTIVTQNTPTSTEKKNERERERERKTKTKTLPCVCGVVFENGGVVTSWPKNSDTSVSMFRSLFDWHTYTLVQGLGDGDTLFWHPRSLASILL